MDIHQTNIEQEDLNGLPLFFRKIYYNELTFEPEELKLIKYSEEIQSVRMRDASSMRPISKTVNFKIFKHD
jgi:hypothetical protein